MSLVGTQGGTGCRARIAHVEWWSEFPCLFEGTFCLMVYHQCFIALLRIFNCSHSGYFTKKCEFSFIIINLFFFMLKHFVWFVFCYVKIKNKLRPALKIPWADENQCSHTNKAQFSLRCKTSLTWVVSCLCFWKSQTKKPVFQDWYEVTTSPFPII